MVILDDQVGSWKIRQALVQDANSEMREAGFGRSNSMGDLWDWDND